MVVRRRSPGGGDLSNRAFSRLNVLVRRLQSRLGDHGRRPVRFWSLAGERGLSLSINHRELLAVERGLRALCACLEGRVVAVFSDNTTEVAYLRRQGRTLSPTLNAVAQRILHWVERLNIILMPQFVPGTNNVVADALSHPNQVIGSEWILHQKVFNWLPQHWPVTIDLFASSLKSPLFCLFCSCVGSHGCGYRWHAPVMGFATGLCLPSIRHNQPGPGGR